MSSKEESVSTAVSKIQMSSREESVSTAAVFKIQMSSRKESVSPASASAEKESLGLSPSYSAAESCSASLVLPESPGLSEPFSASLLSLQRLSVSADRTRHSSFQDDSSSQRDSVKSSLSHEDFNPGGLSTQLEDQEQIS